MKDYIIVGADMSDRSILLKVARNGEKPVTRSFGNDGEGWGKMAGFLRDRAKKHAGAKAVVAYEAGCHGAGLYDFLTGRGIACHVLAPTRLNHTAKSRRQKTDEKDAQRLLEALRGHLLAGNALPTVWIPDPALRDDREVVRGRLDVGRKACKLRTQIRMLLKRWNVCKPRAAGQGWTRTYRAWLLGLTGLPSPLGEGTRQYLASLLRQLDFVERERAGLDEAVARLATTPRYRTSAEAVDAQVGVGILAGMTFLTELGDPERFGNRRQVGAYFGLVPSSDETGERADCKGHITRQGSPRVRGVLCQAYHAEVRNNPEEKARYERLVKRNPKRRKVAVVAGIRRKVIRLWHVALDAKRGAPPVRPPSRPPEGGKRQFTLPAPPRQYERRPSSVEERRRAV